MGPRGLGALTGITHHWIRIVTSSNDCIDRAVHVAAFRAQVLIQSEAQFSTKFPHRSHTRSFSSHAYLRLTKIPLWPVSLCQQQFLLSFLLNGVPLLPASHRLLR